MPVDDSVVSLIARCLDDVEAREGVHVLYACESGSRAWGFESTDSDYDARFLYVRPRDWYLSIDVEHRRDVIEPKLPPPLDISGWDLRKALGLLRRSNPPLLEWLQSPIVYREDVPAITRLRELATAHYSPIACHYHYLRMAEGNRRDYLCGDTVWRKKYLYVMRPLLAVMWIERGYGLVPTEFSALVEQIVGNDELRDAIENLLRAKRAGAELDRGPAIPAISRFIDAELDRLQTTRPEPPAEHPDIEDLNRYFRDVLAAH
jgi:uncharacterized protein